MRGLSVPAQRINLLQQSPGREAGAPLQERSFAVVAALGLLLLLAGYVYFQFQITALQQEKNQLAEQLAGYQQQLQTLRAQLPPMEADPVLLAEMKRLQLSRAQISHAIALIEHRRNADNSGFAELFRSLARHPVEGLWLEDVRMAGNGEQFVLRGQTLQPALVPRLLRSLADEAVFHGRTFREVRFERPVDDTTDALIFELRSQRESTDAG